MGQEVLSDPSQEYLPNKEMALSLENGLRGIHVDLKFFQVADPPKALHANERRICAELSEDQVIPGSCARRIAILNMDTGLTRVEVPRELRGNELLRPVLHKVLDQCSKGLPLTQLLDMGVSLPGTTCYDTWDRLHNDHRQKLISTWHWVVVCERLVWFNFTTAPLHGHGFFQQPKLREAADEYFRLRDSSCPLLRALYEDRSGCRFSGSNAQPRSSRLS